MVRVFRVFLVAQRVKALAESLGAVSVVMGRMLAVLWATMYVFAQVGMLLFGGEIYSTNPRLVETTFATSNYWANNFNDLASSLVTLFELLVVNNWFIILDGAAAATTGAAKIFF